jgi:hypothetical protein
VLGLTMVVMTVAISGGSVLFGDAALGDTISPLSAAGFALWCGFFALFFGGMAFALSPLLGRSGSAGVASIAMILLWLMNGMNVGGPLAVLSPFHWTNNHIALVGIYDWLPLALVGLVGVVFLAIGVEVFTRRDLGVTAGLSLPGLPKPYDTLVADEAAALERVVQSAGRTLVLFSGGSKLGDDDLLRKAHLCMAAGATGLIFGRNMWQRPWDEALAMTRRMRKEVMAKYGRELGPSRAR